VLTYSTSLEVCAYILQTEMDENDTNMLLITSCVLLIAKALKNANERQELFGARSGYKDEMKEEGYCICLIAN
jgi:hypothetical protein